MTEGYGEALGKVRLYGVPNPFDEEVLATDEGRWPWLLSVSMIFSSPR